MPGVSRREFLRTAASVSAAAPAVQARRSAGSPNERINVAVVGFHSFGMQHIRAYARQPNVRVVALCDVDERLFNWGVSEVEELAGNRPDTEVDMRRLLDRPDIDAVSLATPDYWHALQTIWACQAGKDVYVEKPVSFTIDEGRRMVEAARQYGRIVQAGLNGRSSPATRAAMRMLHNGEMGRVYRARTDFSKPRAGIGHAVEVPVPDGVHWDLFLGPSPLRPFTVNRFHYGWHYFWDTSPTEVGNTGVHRLDVCRWAMNKREHPVKVHCTGGFYVWDAEQETPNVQVGTVEYADKRLIDFEVSNLYAPSNGGTTLYTSEGYVTSGGGWRAFRGSIAPRRREHPAGIDRSVLNASDPDFSYSEDPSIDAAATPRVSHFENFIAAVRSRRVEDLHCDILEGHLSTTLAHLAAISYRLGRSVTFDPESETFGRDEEANRHLTREYREPYVLPAKI